MIETYRGKLNICAVVVVFNPDYKNLIDNINSYMAEVSKLYLVCNSQFDTKYLVNDKFEPMSKIEIIQNPENYGIAKALNQAVTKGISENFEWILTMDQDSSFKSDSLSKYFQLIQEYSEKNPHPIFCCNFTHNNQSEFPQNIEFEDVNEAITSGSVIKLNLFREIGFFREDFFIDGVDFEFCYRSKIFNNKILRINSILLSHSLGYASKTKWGFTTLNYSKLRTYFIARNHLILWKMYPQFYSFKRLYVREYIVLRFIKIILSEKSKFSKIVSLLKGIWDGIFYNKEILKWSLDRNSFL